MSCIDLVDDSRTTILSLSPEQRFAQSTYFVHAVMGKMSLYNSMWLDDLHSVGMMKLWSCCQRYDNSVETSFFSYCWPIIRNGIIDEMRRLDPIPTMVRKRIKLIEETRLVLEKETGRAPTENEIFTRAFPVMKDRFAAERANHWRDLRKISLDIDSAETAKIQDDLVAPVDELLQREDIEILQACIDRLPKRTGRIVRMYYADGFNLEEIAKIFRCTEQNISLLLVRARRKLKRWYVYKRAA